MTIPNINTVIQPSAGTAQNEFRANQDLFYAFIIANFLQ